ncbi:purine nucleoside permease [Vararia minispora EC-137]|uniref:Purine nucleoside permease n=1 Tax=Vararia minispora EC-137 TaxID=1314806 RepID=A0ACB8Q9I8_9AGAM|nr:purine nucleoside permease [Vararia minispora EC-137]
MTVGKLVAAALTPKVFIIDFYNDEGAIWYGIPEFDLLAQNTSVPGLSPRYPDVHCTQDGTICQVVTDEGEINAASSISALVASPAFDLRQTYFLLAGIAGISPELATLASVTFGKFAVQVALQYEIDPSELPANWSATGGFIPQGTSDPNAYPAYIYGTEVFQLNDALRQRAIAFAQNATLADSTTAQAYRALYNSSATFAAGSRPPSIVACDTATSDNWWSGNVLAAEFERTTKLFTAGAGTYCTTQQEDNAVHGALVRGNVAGRVDFSRVISIRTGSDFDRPPPGMSASDNLFNGQSAGYEASIENIYRAGVKVVQGIVNEWNVTFAAGVPTNNYVGDMLGSLGGSPPYGPYAKQVATRFQSTKRRGRTRMR